MRFLRDFAFAFAVVLIGLSTIIAATVGLGLVLNNVFGAYAVPVGILVAVSAIIAVAIAIEGLDNA